MVTEEQRARLRRLYFAEHWKVGTIAAELDLRLSTLPGEQAQVDWAHFGRLRIGGAERPLCAFVLVLSRTKRPLRALRPGAVPGELPALPHPGLPGAGRGAALPAV
ncbi:hypothetical protein [Archangium violaceum]|uniref:hypothetical protein n=1 Tax=Archangium violaceum TaxID=83451 RepID=UPI001EF05EB0|nr:hypothetical protein [Archangium violaceum]